jgi:hypothetical protein
VRWLLTLALCWMLSGSAHADDSAKQRFDEGIAAAAAGRLEEAVEQLEASLRASDKPATRYNLVVAYQALGRPLELARHALAFLALPVQAGRESARARVEELLGPARLQLAQLDMTEAPAEASLEVIAGPAPVVDGTRWYLLPGVQALQVRAGPYRATRELDLRAGQVVRWAELVPEASAPVVAPGVAIQATHATYAEANVGRVPPPDDALTLGLVRKRAAWTLGVVGAGLAVAGATCMWVTVRRGDDLADGGIEGSSEPGYFTASDRYWNAFNAVMPLAFTGGALMAGAIPVGGRIAQRGSLAWAIGTLTVGAALLGVGSYWLIRQPDALIETTDLERPSRQAGSLMIAAGLPLATYGIAFLVQYRRSVHVALRGVSGVRVTW